MLAASLDFETRSAKDLLKCGVHSYAEDSTTGIWGFSFRIPGGVGETWLPGMPEPVDLLNWIAQGGIVRAHNAVFERTIWNVIIIGMMPHWPLIRIEQQDCTMARAAAVSHPQSLDALGTAVNADEVKDSEGHGLMLKMCKPRRFRPDGTIEWWDDPKDVQRLMYGYCQQDVRSEIAIDAKIPLLTDAERKVWQLDQVINDRGIPIDLEFVRKAAELVEFAKKEADKEMRCITNRAVPKCTNDAKLVAWIASRGLDCDSVKKGVQDDLIFMASLNNDTQVKEAIELRAAAKKTSTAKYKAALNCTCKDGRVRGLLAYHGAGPGRWAGRLLQPQNFPRLDHEKDGEAIACLHGVLEGNDTRDAYEVLTMLYGQSAPLRLLSRALRSMVRAPNGKKLVGGDFSNIEGRKNAWFADEEWKLQAFRDYDAIIGVDKRGKPIRRGPDLYKLAYAKSFGVSVDIVQDNQRQIGKVQELALGYQGGIGAYIDMGDTYGVNPYDISKPVQDATSGKTWDNTAARYASAKNKFNLQEREWTALQVLVDGFRAANQKIVQSWWDYQDAAIEAVASPGSIVGCAGGRVRYYSDGRCLWCVLPSGRMICYASPQLEQSMVEYVDKYTGETKERLKRSVSFWGVDSETKRWCKKYLYGGLQCENIVQGSSRDVMVDRMFAIEAAGYPIILTVHDELLSEVPDSQNYSARHYEEIMSVLPPYCAGLPLAVKAWEDERYIK